MNSEHKLKNKTKTIALIAMITLLITAIVLMATVIVSADTYYNIRITYVFKDGTPAHDAYVATYPAGEPVDLTVTNPDIDGFVPMTAAENGESAHTSTFYYDSLNGDVNITVYYIAGMTHYRALYYKQNLYDDLYTRDNTLPANLTDRYGLTGSNPTDLEDIQFEGFTNLFHEPDAIAADGSTVFRIYYDRNYYTVNFDLGEHGYGLDPVYAKYQSVYHITQPKRLGYTFEGFLRTDKDSSKGEYKYASGSGANGSRSDTTWTFIDENGDELLDGSGNPLFNEHGMPIDENVDVSQYYLNFTDGTIPAHDTFYKAVWLSGTTNYSVVYWLENPDGADLTREDIEQTADINEARALIAQNYTVVVARDIKNVPSGTLVNLHTIIQNARGQDMELYNLFAYDLTNTTNFPMSDALRSELVGKEKYYDFNEDLSMLQFNGIHEDDPTKENIEVMGDGTTRINVYYDRKDFILKFYYARQKLNNGVANGAIDLTNSTKPFSNYAYYNKTNQTYKNALSQGTWQSDIAETLPQIDSELLVENGGPLTADHDDFNGYRYYYYQISAKYNAPLTDKWRIDAISSVNKKGYAGQICYPGSWAVENGTAFYNSHTSVNNFTVKGVYERLGDELMFTTNTSSNFQELHYLLSWTNTATSGWNYGTANVLHFTYENFVELLPREVDLMTHDDIGDGTPDGVQGLINAGLYEDVYELRNGTFTHIDPAQTFVYHADAVYYGLKTENRIETTDSGSQYPYNDMNKKTASVRSDQVPTELRGFKLINADIKTDKGQIKLDESNTIVDWSDDTNSYRHATVKFFYNRRSYKLKWRNGNVREDDHERDVKYGAPLNSYYRDTEDGHQAGDYRYWFSDPVYFNADLRDYYNFIGWYYTPYYYRMVDKDTATMPADDMTLYARWDPKVINVSFYPTYNDYYSGTNRIGDPVPIHYGDYMEMHDIPANVEEDPDNLRPDLTPPSDGAMFAGWYYLRDNQPVRFDPENVPITALNYEASASAGARLRLYAEWASKDAAKYQVTYVEKDHPEIEVAESTDGRAFVWKTRTFNAKGGAELNEDHSWTEDGINWWPTSQSHSLVIRANSQGHLHEFEPNVYAFEYVQKQGVWYRVQYLDAASRTPLLDPEDMGKDAIYSTHGSIKEDAPFIPGYIAEKMSQSMVLTASTEGTAEQQKAEELENNVITFYYNKNVNDYLYEVEYYRQNAEDDGYSYYLTENLEIPIADDPETEEVEGTYVRLSELLLTRVPQLIISDGFTHAANTTEIEVTAAGGVTTTETAADNASVQITGTEKTTIRLYFNRNAYPYVYQYVDYHAEQIYNQMLEEGEDVSEQWNGILETFDQNDPEKVEATVTIPAPRDTTYEIDGESVPYTRLTNSTVTLTIAPTNALNPDVNLVKVYYKKFYERELEYKLACKNENDPHTEVDYNHHTGNPLYGGLSMTLQTIESYDDIQNVTFYNFNTATDATGADLHNHQYKFCGWFDNPEGTGTPLKAAIDDPHDPNYNSQFTLTKADLGLEEGTIPVHNVTYYAVVEQVMVSATFEFRYVEDELPSGGEPIDDVTGETQTDLDAKDIVRNAPSDPDGNYTGSYFAFSDPFNYENGSLLPYQKSGGYTMDILPKEDDLVYKYEFAEWWEEDLYTKDPRNPQYNQLIRRKDLNQSGDWGDPTSLLSQLDRHNNKHIIAVFKRRDVTELNYTINYQFQSRIGDTEEERTKTFVLKGTLNENQLNENHEDCAITNDGDYRLTDEFILKNAPYESNYGETLRWSNGTDDEGNPCITKTSHQGSPAVEAKPATNDQPAVEARDAIPDMTVATIKAKQNTRTVYAHYRTTPTGAYNDPIVTFYGANYKLDEQMKAIEAPASYDGMAFSCWAVRKSSSADAPIVAKSYDKLFDLCMMDSYYLSPVYEGAAAGPGTKSAKLDATTNNIAQNNEDWIAWTWNEGEEGVWVRPDSDMTFHGLKDYVKFARVPAGTSITGGVWDETFEANVWNYTEDDDQVVQDGQTLILTGYYQNNTKYIAGEWSNTSDPEEPGEEPAESTSEPSVTLTHLDYTRNRWTDENGNIDSSGETDLLFSDFEIAFEDNGSMIYQSEDYKTGLILEYCATVPDSATFNPDRDYRQVTDYDNLETALKSYLDGQTVTQYSYKANKNRSIVFCDIPTDVLTDHNRIEFYRYIYNSYINTGTEENPVYTHNKCNYLIKVTAYLVDKDGNVTFSRDTEYPVYMCYKTIASQDSAYPSIIEGLSD